MEQLNRPIFGLLKEIEEREIQSEALLLINYLEAKNIQDLVRYSRKELEEIEVSVPTLDKIEEVLKSKYDIFLGYECGDASISESDQNSEVAKSIDSKIDDIIQTQGSESTIETHLVTSEGKKGDSTVGSESKVTCISGVYRGYAVEDNNTSLIVNGEVIPISLRPNSYSKEQLLLIYENHSNGKGIAEIARLLGKKESAKLTIKKYLRLAKVIPHEGSRRSSKPRSTQVIRGGYLASGAPPKNPLFEKRVDSRKLHNYLQ